MTNEVSISDDRSIVNNEINDFYHEHSHQEDPLSTTDLLTPAMCLLVKARLDNIDQRARQILESINARSL